MKPLRREWLVDMAVSIHLEGEAVLAGLHEAVTGYEWVGHEARAEANKLLSRIAYRTGQIQRTSVSLVEALKASGTEIKHPASLEDRDLASWVSGVVLLDIGTQSGWQIRDMGAGIAVHRRNPEYDVLSQVDYGLMLRRDAVAWLDLVMGQLKSFKASTGRLYGSIR